MARTLGGKIGYTSNNIYCKASYKNIQANKNFRTKMHREKNEQSVQNRIKTYNCAQQS